MSRAREKIYLSANFHELIKTVSYQTLVDVINISFLSTMNNVIKVFE